MITYTNLQFSAHSYNQCRAFPLLEMRKTRVWRHNMAALNSPEGTLAEIFNLHFFRVLPVYIARLSLTQQHVFYHFEPFLRVSRVFTILSNFYE